MLGYIYGLRSRRCLKLPGRGQSHDGLNESQPEFCYFGAVFVRLVLTPGSPVCCVLGPSWILLEILCRPGSMTMSRLLDS